jgi:hypothetical protein
VDRVQRQRERHHAICSGLRDEQHALREIDVGPAHGKLFRGPQTGHEGQPHPVFGRRAELRCESFLFRVRQDPIAPGPLPAKHFADAPKDRSVNAVLIDTFELTHSSAMLPIEEAIVNRLQRGPCGFNELVFDLPDFTWEETFDAVGCMSRDGQVCLRHLGDSIYRLSLGPRFAQALERLTLFHLGDSHLNRSSPFTTP